MDSRLRITFAKTDAMRFTSHLDLHRTWERTIRRANLPLAYSQGYNPHPKINLASALPLGFTGAGEIVDIWLEQALLNQEIESALAKAAPPGIRIVAIQQIDLHEPSLQTVLESSEYTITFLERLPNLETRVQEILAAEELPRERRGKMYDLRPLIVEMHALPDKERGLQRLYARMTAQEGATGRPDELLAVLGANQIATRVHRTGLIFKEMP
jgi:radical SAM-linked protein